jgi:hypothetical protein
MMKISLTYLGESDLGLLSLSHNAYLYETK